jgi:hypothetical protein
VFLLKRWMLCSVKVKVFLFFFQLNDIDCIFAEERLDYESERASLMSNARSPSVRSSPRRKAATERGWVSRLLYRDDRSTYQPIGEGDE